MRFFDEVEKSGKAKKPVEALVLMSFEEASIIVAAMEDYIKSHPRMKKAKALEKEMGDYWALY